MSHLPRVVRWVRRALTWTDSIHILVMYRDRIEPSEITYSSRNTINEQVLSPFQPQRWTAQKLCAINSQLQHVFPAVTPWRLNSVFIKFVYKLLVSFTFDFAKIWVLTENWINISQYGFAKKQILVHNANLFLGSKGHTHMNTWLLLMTPNEEAFWQSLCHESINSQNFLWFARKVTFWGKRQKTNGFSACAVALVSSIRL